VLKALLAALDRNREACGGASFAATLRHARAMPGRSAPPGRTGRNQSDLFCSIQVVARCGRVLDLREWCPIDVELMAIGLDFWGHPERDPRIGVMHHAKLSLNSLISVKLAASCIQQQYGLGVDKGPCLAAGSLCAEGVSSGLSGPRADDERFRPEGDGKTTLLRVVLRATSAEKGLVSWGPVDQGSGPNTSAAWHTHRTSRP